MQLPAVNPTVERHQQTNRLQPVVATQIAKPTQTLNAPAKTVQATTRFDPATNNTHQAAPKAAAAPGGGTPNPSAAAAPDTGSDRTKPPPRGSRVDIRV